MWPKLKEALTSKKFWAMVAGVSASAAGGLSGAVSPTEALVGVVTSVSVYMAAQGQVDTAKAKSGESK